VFINRQTGKSYGTIMKVWSRLRKAAGVPHLRIHNLRHQFASFLVNSGRTLYEEQQILGHSDPSVTQRYAHLSSESLQDVSNSASVAIRGSSPTVNETSNERTVEHAQGTRGGRVDRGAAPTASRPVHREEDVWQSIERELPPQELRQAVQGQRDAW
jgi:hypothetical protein